MADGSRRKAKTGVLKVVHVDLGSAGRLLLGGRARSDYGVDAHSSATAPSAESKLTSSAQANNSAQTRAALLGNISTQPGQAATSASHSENSSAQTGQPTSSDASNPLALVSQPGVSSPAPPT